VPHKGRKVSPTNYNFMHNINKDLLTGKMNFVSSNNQNAWHGLGTVLPQEFLTSEEVLKYVRLNYNVALAPAYAKIGDIYVPIPDTKATYREDSNMPFAAVGNKYTIVQNMDAFKFFDSIIENGEAIYETAGILGKGERIFLCAKLPNYITIDGTKDVTQMYIVLTLSHDGSGSVKAMLTPIRVVCENTLRMAIGAAKNTINIRHTSSADVRLSEAAKLMGITNTYVDEVNTMLNKLATATIDMGFADMIISKVFDNTKDGEKQSTKTANILTAVKADYLNGVGQDGIINTAYGLFNGITHYFDHTARTLTNESKFLSSFGGKIGNDRDKVFELITTELGFN
jgi:phage/plasmid-like protein (TIGR03299 family)